MHQVAQAAGDTLLVLATPPGNINTVINSDTLAGGVRAHPDRVYKLRHGNVYQVTEPIRVNGSLHMCANDTTAGLRPPVLAPAILTDNSSPGVFIQLIGKGAQVTLQDLYLLNVRVDQNWGGWSEAIQVSADSVQMKLRGVVFDAWSSAGIRVYAQWTKLDVQDCVFRNHQHSSAWFGGQPFMTDAPNHLDTVKFINNTFFANNSYSWSIRGYDVHSVFEHNTMVYGTVNPFLMRQGSHMFIKNNLFYAMHAMGGNPDHVINGWFLNYPDTASSSILRVRGTDSVSSWATQVWGTRFTGPEAYVDSAHGVTVPMVAPALRVYDFRNNGYYWPTKLTNFYQAYNDTAATYDSIDVPTGVGGAEAKARVRRTLYKPTWISEYAQWTLDSLYKPQGAAVNTTGNMEADPGFGNAGVLGHLDSLIAYVHKISTNKLDSTWHFKPSGALYPPTWPLPEVLSYSNAAMQSAGTDGFALGDLNWFPTQKAAWLLTDVKQLDQQPQEYALAQNYPNPFNPTTTIQFSIAKSELVRLVVYNMLGQKVRTIVNQEMAAGTFTASWDGRNDAGRQLASGAYFYRLETKDFAKTMTMLLLK